MNYIYLCKVHISTAKYIQSVDSVEKCPKPTLPEFAFIGRSNVGKSSLINFLTGSPKLALTSSKPGKTKAINHFLVNEKWYLVDLPGYGYAQISRDQREKWMYMIQKYLLTRKNLLNTFVLVDGSIEPQESDIRFINWLGENGIPFCIVMTKVDKAKTEAVNNQLEMFITKLKEFWEEIPQIILTSVNRKEGKEEILGYITTCIKEAGFTPKTA
jgi:GTP-binding protein